jgi:hypothetical protein
MRKMISSNLKSGLNLGGHAIKKIFNENYGFNLLLGYA